MRNLCIALLLAAATACDAEAPRPVDTPVAPVAEESPDDIPEPRPAPSTWDPAAGSVLLVAGEHPDQVIIVSPDVDGVLEPESLDVSELVGSAATLYARSGALATVTLGPETHSGASSACNSWPVLTAPAGTARWSVGFLDGAVQPVAMDSVHTMSRRDSTTLVSSIARLASGLGMSRSGAHAASFQGLPFVVHDVRRFTHGTVEVAVAQVVRRVNQEANPLEEYILLIAERPAGGEWRVARAARSAGHEESVGRQELLTAVLLRGEPVLILMRDSGSEVQYVIRWRSGGTWAKTWRSAVSRC